MPFSSKSILVVVLLVLFSSIQLVNSQEVTRTVVEGGDDIVPCLREIGDGSRTIGPGHRSFRSASRGFNLRFNYRPVAVFYPTTEVHVQGAVRCASQFNVNVAPRGGGHSYTGESQGGRDGSLIVDFARMTDIQVDADDISATVQPGVRLGRLYVELWDAGEWAFPGGSCPTVGVSGFLLGGGFGFLANELGLGADSILEMRVVNANGEVVVASHQDNTDLFWALRGAGHGSFGIVTSFKLRIYQVNEPVTCHIFYTFEADDRDHILQTYSRWASTVPSKMTTSASHQVAETQIYGIYLGARDEAEAFMDTLIDELGIEAETTSISEHPLIESHLHMSDVNTTTYRNMADFSEDRADRYWKSSGLFYPEPLKNSTVAVIERYLELGRENYVSADLDYFGGLNSQVSNVPTDENAWIHREQLFALQIYVSWGDYRARPGRRDCEECLRVLDAFQRALVEDFERSYPEHQLRIYQNYPDANTRNWQSAFYGDAFERLTQIKAVYDPNDLFQFPMSIPVGTLPPDTSLVIPDPNGDTFLNSENSALRRSRCDPISLLFALTLIVVSTLIN